MKTILIGAVKYFGYLFALIFLVTSILFANEQFVNKPVTVTLTVLPLRIIIVDKTLRIIKIISNTGESVRPIVYMEEEDGPEIPYSESVQKQYELLKSSLNFSEPGIIYQREERIFPSFFKFIGRTTKKWFGVPF